MSSALTFICVLMLSLALLLFDMNDECQVGESGQMMDLLQIDRFLYVTRGVCGIHITCRISYILETKRVISELPGITDEHLGLSCASDLP